MDIYECIRRDDVEGVRAAIQRGERIDGWSLNYAFQYGHIDIVRLLVKSGATFNPRKVLADILWEYIYSPDLHHRNLLYLLENYNIDLNQKEDNIYLRRDSYYMDFSGNPDVCPLLVRYGAKRTKNPKLYEETIKPMLILILLVHVKVFPSTDYLRRLKPF
jgi:ankyrin repeat protein